MRILDVAPVSEPLGVEGAAIEGVEGGSGGDLPVAAVTEAERELGGTWRLGQVAEHRRLLGDGPAIAGAGEWLREEGGLEVVDTAAQERPDQGLAGAQPGGEGDGGEGVDDPAPMPLMTAPPEFT